VLQWDVSASLPDGAIVTSTDAGATWRKRSVVSGTPHALLVTDNTIFVANQDGIYASDDEGGTFTTMMDLAAAR
jgi:hypothetical protein